MGVKGFRFSLANLVRRSRMATPRRRWLQVSLRTAFVVLTVFAIGLGVLMNRAREQRMLVEKIESIGGVVHFAPIRIDDPQGSLPLLVKAKIKLYQVLGYDYFAEIEAVFFQRDPLPTDAEVLEVVHDLTRLRGLTSVVLPASVSQDTWNKVEAALPNCMVGRVVK